MINDEQNLKDFFAKMDREWQEREIRINNLIDLIELNGHDYEMILQAFVDDLRKHDPQFLELEDDQDDTIIVDKPF